MKPNSNMMLQPPFSLILPTHPHIHSHQGFQGHTQRTNYFDGNMAWLMLEMLDLEGSWIYVRQAASWCFVPPFNCFFSFNHPVRVLRAFRGTHGGRIPPPLQECKWLDRLGIIRGWFQGIPFLLKTSSAMVASKTYKKPNMIRSKIWVLEKLNFK